MNILYLNNIMGVGGVEKCIIQLSKLLKDDNKIVVATAGGELTGELEGLNVKHYEISSTDSKNPISILKNILNIVKIIKKEQIDLVHSHHRMTTFYAKIISKFIKIRVIHTQHLCIEDKKLLTRVSLKNIPVITVSNGAKENLVQKYGLDERYISTIYNTIETENSNYEVDEKLLQLRAENKFVVAHISRLVDYKGIYDFLQIAKIISNQDTDIRFVIIGDGPEREKVQIFIENNKLQNNVFLLGNKDNIINQMKCIDLVLLCSYIEGLPLVPLEAFSQGIPVIGTNIGGTNEEIKSGVNGYLIEKKDIDGFVNKVLEVYKDKSTYKILSKNSYEIFGKMFNKQEYKLKHNEFYENNK